MKKGSYRKIKFTIDRDDKEEGSFIVRAYYKGKNVKVRIKSPNVWEWIGNPLNNKKWNEARKFCYDEIVKSYNS